MMRLDWSVQKCQLVELGPAGNLQLPPPSTLEALIRSKPQSEKAQFFNMGPFYWP